MGYNLCIIKPNKSSYSETFIQAHIDRLAGNKKVLYGGTFPVYDNEGEFLIRSFWLMLKYLVKKRIFKQDNISELNTALANYLSEQNIDVVLAEYGMVGVRVMNACKIAAVPLVIHFHGADAHHQPTVQKYKKQYKEAFDYAKAIVVVSQDMFKSLLQLGAPADKLFLNPYGVDIEKFSQVNVAASDMNFVSVGRFVEKKAPLTTIEAFKVLSEKLPDAHLWMVGEGPLLNSAQQKVKELNLNDAVTFTGVKTPSQIIDLFKNMRCFVQHSVTADDGDMEGTPNTILEASASGLPIVSTRHAGIKEAVLEGVTGLLCQEYDTEGMALNMLTLAESKGFSAQLGIAGRNHIMKNYNIRDRISTLDNIIQESINHQIN